MEGGRGWLAGDWRRTDNIGDCLLLQSSLQRGKCICSWVQAKVMGGDCESDRGREGDEEKGGVDEIEQVCTEVVGSFRGMC